MKPHMAPGEPQAAAIRTSMTKRGKTLAANQTHAADETAILKVLKGVYEAWNANDADAFVAEYTEDASAILPGSYRKSRDEIRASLEAGWLSVMNMP